VVSKAFLKTKCQASLSQRRGSCCRASFRFSKYLVGKKFPSTPLPESWKPEEGSDADRAEARGLPYRELIGVLAYPSTHVKLEIRLAISLLSRYLHAPTKEHFKMALRTPMYCVGTHDIDIMYSRGVDEHVVNEYVVRIR
jgi:hypothetical protein